MPVFLGSVQLVYGMIMSTVYMDLSGGLAQDA